MDGSVLDLVIGTVVGLTASALFVIFLLVGFAVVVGFTKLRPSGGKTLIVRSLDEMVGGTAAFLPPTAPRGPADQLHTPELAEKKTQPAVGA
ncbi:MAG: hypothetical protein FJW23_09200 [Acidimicrobiia bacterium]|nr:hypothetical protein [Acidimicrobiia bacterium]